MADGRPGPKRITLAVLALIGASTLVGAAIIQL